MAKEVTRKLVPDFYEGYKISLSYLIKPLILIDGTTYIGIHNIEWPLAQGQPDSDYIFVTDATQYRPDLISASQYGTPYYWWVVLKHNRIMDAFQLTSGKIIEIPAIDKVLNTLTTLRDRYIR